MKSDSTRAESLCIQQFQTCSIEVFKDPRSSSKEERIYDEAQLIEMAKPEQKTHTSSDPSEVHLA
jgi:hypothetical protein